MIVGCGCGLVGVSCGGVALGEPASYCGQAQVQVRQLVEDVKPQGHRIGGAAK